MDTLCYLKSYLLETMVKSTNQATIKTHVIRKQGDFLDLLLIKNYMDKQFPDIVQHIKQSRTNAIKAVNTALINLYWNIGECISKKIGQLEWGYSVVT